MRSFFLAPKLADVCYTLSMSTWAQSADQSPTEAELDMPDRLAFCIGADFRKGANLVGLEAPSSKQHQHAKRRQNTRSKQGHRGHDFVEMADSHP